MSGTDFRGWTIKGVRYRFGLYDSRNQLTQINYPSGHVVDYGYTDRRQLDTIQWQATQIEDRGYDVGGRLTSIDRAFTDEVRTYDTANRLMSIDNTGVGRLDYTWDANGNKLSEIWSGVMSDWSFTTEKPSANQYTDGYDKEDRFRRFNRSGQTQELYLDRSDIGNIFDVKTNGTSELRDFGLAHELKSVGSNNQIFDAKGNVKFTHSGFALNWDFDNQLRESSIGKAQVEYQYDALGRRVKKGSTVYIYGGPNCFAEYTSGTAPASPAQEYVYGDQIDSLVVISRNSDTQRLLATRNQQWSVVSLVDIADGGVKERYTYDHFGKRTVLDATGVEIASTQYANPYGYTSRRHDSESGLMYFRARFYDQSTGEFTSRDPLEYIDGMSSMRGYLGLDWLDSQGYNKVRINQEFTEKGCTGCGNFEWESKISIAGVDGFADRRKCQRFIVQRLCVYRREAFCKTEDGCCTIDLERDDRVTKCCFNELLTVLEVGDGRAFKDDWKVSDDYTFDGTFTDNWKLTGAGNSACRSLGHAMFVSEIFVLSGSDRRGSWQQNVKRDILRDRDPTDGKKIECGKHEGSKIEFQVLHGPDKIPDFEGAPRKPDSRTVVGGFWDCCPKPDTNAHCWQSSGPDVEKGIGLDVFN